MIRRRSRCFSWVPRSNEACRIPSGRGLPVNQDSVAVIINIPRFAPNPMLVGLLLVTTTWLGILLHRNRGSRWSRGLPAGPPAGSEAHYQELVESSLVAVLVLADGRIRHVNRAGLVLLGARGPDEVVGREFIDFVLPQIEYVVQASARSFEEALSQTSLLEQRLRRLDGMMVDVELTSLPTSWRGAPALQVTMRDTTDRKRADEEVRRQELRFRSLIENLHEVIAILAPDGVPSFLSPSSRRMLGYRLADVLGKSLFEFIHPEDRDRILPMFADLARRAGAVASAEFRLRHKDGSWRHVDLAGQNMAEEPAVGGIVINYRDITDRKAAEEALRTSEDRLRQSQKLDSIGRLAGGIAHDFNNILTVINGFSELLLRREDLPEPARERITEVRKAGERAATLVHQLLTFSRAQPATLQPVDLNFQVLDMERMLRRLIGEDITLITRLDPTLDRVLADPGQVQQVLMNLAVNARDAMPDGGRLEIETANEDGFSTGHAAGPRVRLMVRDSGVGMDEGVRARLFEPFFTTKSPGKGTGLGLSIVYGIVTAAGGAIEVDSAPGRGAAFILHWLRAERPERGAAGVDAAGTRGVETVLIVEDEVMVRLLAREILETVGYRVLEASDTDEALALCDQYTAPVHLALVDVVLPGRPSHEFAAGIRTARPATRLLLMSGYTDRAVVHPLIASGNVPFLEKPFTAEGLARKVREVLDAPADATW